MNRHHATSNLRGTLIRAVDFVGNPGGGMRFVVELLYAMASLRPDHEFELISHGEAYLRYHEALSPAAENIKVVNISPEGNWRNKRSLPKLSFPGKTQLKRTLSKFTKWHYDVPPSLTEGCDVLWLPWLHWHRLPPVGGCRIVGSFHDAIIFQFDLGLAKVRIEDERTTIQGWIDSEVEIVVSSRSTASSLQELFTCVQDRFQIIPLSGAHRLIGSPTELPSRWAWINRPYLIYPANITPHKNHEMLIDAIASWKSDIPVALTGPGSDLKGSGRGIQLRRYADSKRLLSENRLIALGFVSDQQLDTLIRGAAGLIMCSLAEGGGSFPIWEAMLHGIPVLCSDIPVMREQLERTGGSVIWFDPQDPGDLVEKLRDLEMNYAAVRSDAEVQKESINRRLWVDVANDYLNMFDDPGL